MHTPVFIAAFHQRWEWLKCPSMEEWINKILFSLKKERNSDTCYSMSEPWEHYTKWNKLVAKDMSMILPNEVLQFSRSVVSNSLRPHGLQHTRPPCPSATPGACSNSCPSTQWCHPAISSSVVPSSFCLHSFPAAGSFPMSQFFTSGGQSIGVSASASVLPMNIQDWFPLGLTDWISLQSKGFSRVFSNTTVQKHQCSAFFMVQLSHPYMTTGKIIALTR